MQPYSLHHADSLDETFSLLERYGDDDVHLIAGGTSLMLLMNLGLVEPAHVISLRRIAELRGIRPNNAGLEVGALATHRQLELSPEIRGYCPALSAAFGDVATVRIRNQGTLGGNLAHADPAQDPPPMLIALDAEVTLASRGAERRVPLDTFFVDYLTTVIQPGEVLTTIHLPALPSGTRAAYTKFLPRTHDDYATVSVAATLWLDDEGRCGVKRRPIPALPKPRRWCWISSIHRMTRAAPPHTSVAWPAYGRSAHCASFVTPPLELSNDCRTKSTAVVRRAGVPRRRPAESDRRGALHRRRADAGHVVAGLHA
jgi:carbon-monoxide dehydrogenase medium subunit